MQVELIDNFSCTFSSRLYLSLTFSRKTNTYWEETGRRRLHVIGTATPHIRKSLDTIPPCLESHSSGDNSEKCRIREKMSYWDRQDSNLIRRGITFRIFVHRMIVLHLPAYLLESDCWPGQSIHPKVVHLRGCYAKRLTKSDFERHHARAYRYVFSPWWNSGIIFHMALPGFSGGTVKTNPSISAAKPSPIFIMYLPSGNAVISHYRIVSDYCLIFNSEIFMQLALGPLTPCGRTMTRSVGLAAASLAGICPMNEFSDLLEM